ncbi:MAG: thioredoxin family protein [Acidobacteriota bacterium]
MRKFILVFILIFTIPLISAERSGRDEIFEKHVWKQIYDEYSFDPGIIEILKSKADKFTSVDIYFAFWCGDSETNVPPLMRILDEIGKTGIKVNYFIVNRKKPGDKYYFEKLKVERIPAFIFFKDNRETGRIIENPKKTLEEDLLEILF